MNKSEKLKRCADCRNNFYNGTGATECWSLDTATAATVLVVPTWQEWPEKHMKPIERLSCWQPKKGTSAIKRVGSE